MYMDIEEIVYHPIGIVHSEFKSQEETPKSYTESGEVKAEIIINPAYLVAMSGIEAGKEYMVLFHFHKSLPFRQIVSKRGDGPLTPLFSTHSPNRPNPIGVSVITVTEVLGNIIKFKGVDMMDGTPILDIKSV
ncbi:MAG: SAM-dependent methyltransferase [Methanosphaera stadtmanae]|nr:SAM-dependent methyltransferase [Methanosphaera stadtmanae]